MASGLGEAIDRFNSRGGEPSQREEAPAEKPAGKSSGTHGHVHAIHSHKDGSHHLIVHHGGQMIHHSEHPSFEEAHAAMKQHAMGGQPSEDSQPGESM
jgi:hypothetical protein